MDIPITFAVMKGVPLLWRGLGLRAAYRGLTKEVGYRIHDRINPRGAVARNAVGGPREMRSREWGGWWASHLLHPPPPLTVEERMAQPFLIMPGRTQEELREHNRFAMQYGIYEPASRLIEQIRNAVPGANNTLPRLHLELNSTHPESSFRATTSIIDLFAVNWHRAMQTAWFKEKIDKEWTLAKMVEKANNWKMLIQLWNKALHGLNDGTMKSIFDKLIKLLSLAS